MQNNPALAPNEYEEEVSREKSLQELITQKIAVYPDKYSKKQTIQKCKTLQPGSKIQTAGRLVLIRNMGKLIFAHIQDITGKIQLALQKDKIDNKKFIFFNKYFNLGDFIGVKGELFVTHKGELTILVKDFKFLGKALKPMPAKWHGLENQELKYRQRYLDLIANEDTRKRFLFRSELIKSLREFYWKNGFMEVETPILGNSASGALAKPFKTHHNALDLDVYLRIAPEIYLKECIIGGYEKIFEIGRVFRNEGMDPSHLQDFTMLEHYCAYWNFKDNMKFTEKMLVYLLQKLTGSLKIEIPDRVGNLTSIDFTPPWEIISFRDLLIKDINIDIDQYPQVENLREVIKKKGVILEDMEVLGRGNLIDALYKEVSRKKIIKPTFIISHPIDISPLARQNDTNKKTVDRFQLIINTWEVVNAYSELVDPTEQEKRFNQQAKLKEKGDQEAHGKDDEYIQAMKYGMPPISGLGMGLDRLTALLTQQTNLRDVVLFPLMRPEIK